MCGVALTFNTADNQFGWGNAGFTGTVNGSEYKQTTSSYLPSGCNSSEYQGAYNISFNDEKVTISLKPSDICKIHGANSFSEITAFVLNHGIVSNLQFRVTEVNVHNGWISVSSTSPDGTFTVTNTIKTGSLKLRKIWQDNKDGNQSGVWVNLYRSLTPPGNSVSSVSSQSTVNRISQTFALLRMILIPHQPAEKFVRYRSVTLR